jgi:hypothetical protein
MSGAGGKRPGCFRAPSVGSGRSFRRALTAAMRPLLPMRAAAPGDRYAVIPVVPSNGAGTRGSKLSQLLPTAVAGIRTSGHLVDGELRTNLSLG